MSRCSVILLTLCFFLGGCAYIDRRFGEQCKSRAFIATDIEQFISARFPSKAPVRLAVIPFSAPANLSGVGSEFPGIGNEIAWRLHQELIQSGLSPVVEVFNRQSWPGKKDEFFTGNFGALQYAREAGYDLIMVGWVESPRDTDRLTVDYKVIEVDAGITVHYGRTFVSTIRPELAATYDELRPLSVGDRRPSEIHTPVLLEKAARCIVHELRHAEE